MLNSAILEVIIGLVFVYILLSLLVSQINSVVASMLNIRAKQLRTRVENIIFDQDLQKTLLAHPVVGIIQPKGLETGISEEDISKAETARVNKLNPTTFAKAMINVLSDPFLNFYAALGMVKDKRERAGLQTIVNQLRANMNDPQRANAALVQLHEAITDLEPSDRDDRRALLRTLSPLQTALKNQQAGNSKLVMVWEGVSQVENRAFQQAMETVLSGVGNLKEAELAIESWFDAKMSQTSDWYATTMQYFSLAFGLLIAILLNIDTIHLSATLWNDESLRQSIAQTAQAADFSEFIDDEGNLITVPNAVGVDGSVTGGEETSGDSVDSMVQSYEAAQETLNQLLALRLPIGWTFRTPGSVDEIDLGDGSTISVYDPLTDSRNLYRFLAVGDSGWFGFVMGKLGGLAVTAIAVAQGAPFWFDVLRRLAGQSSPAKEEDAG
jgi:hypothetical protein